MEFINIYIKQIINYDLINKFKYTSVNSFPKIQKINLNFECRTSFLKILLPSLVALEIISAQKSVLTYAKESNIQFKIKKGSPVSCTVVLRKKPMLLFVSNLIVLLSNKKVQLKTFLVKKKKMFSFVIKNPLIFDVLEKRYSYFNQLTRLNITIVSNSKNKVELKFLLNSLKVLN
uniref:Ribosomal protein L5 n=1 Tax=Lithodesmium undulatum TaxID=59812 RepID=A0A7T6UZN5_LITUN|nr:ribosomal protein L5 [Lithodesmium undulatum]QQJ94651.1 ribosomal protein L5 [Lithodesmium undulatum]